MVIGIIVKECMVVSSWVRVLEVVLGLVLRRLFLSLVFVYWNSWEGVEVLLMFEFDLKIF